MKNLEEIYLHFCTTPSDINEHLPTLRSIAEECETITEFGVRWVVSTWALLAARPKRLHCYDINHNPNIENVKNLASQNNVDFKFDIANVIDNDFEIADTDFLFIDTLHTYDQLSQELTKHGNKAKKYLGFHDTITYGRINESGIKGDIQGLKPAIENYLLQNQEWIVHIHHTNNNGLTILKRLS